MIRTHLRSFAPLACALALAACSGGGDGGPAAPLPSVSARGGAGRTGAGGAGGSFGVFVTSGAGASIRPGVAAPALSVPAVPAPDLGANPRTLSADAALVPVGGQILGDDGANPATGVWVKAGATLTLDPGEAADAFLEVGGAIRVDGAIRTTVIEADRTTAQIRLYAGALHVSAGGRIDATPPDSDGEGLRSGGVTVRAAGAISNAGAIVGRGGRGTLGGPGGDVDLGTAAGPLVNTGLIDGSGGEGTDGPGGRGVGASLWGIWSEGGTCDAFTTGRIVARGGDGTAGGGDGGYVYVSGCAVGDTFSAGELDTSGGAATVEGPGGNGGTVYFEASDGQALASGALRARGGRAAAGNGGSGGGVRLLATGSTDAVRAAVLAQLDAGGGDGAVGGNGGDVAVVQEGFADGDVRVELGTGAVDVGGGDGAEGGGDAGGIAIANMGDAPTLAPAAAVAADGMNVEAALRASGGAGGTGAGGWGGYVEVSGAQVACGPVSVDGGASTAMAGGTAGYVELTSAGATTAVGAPLTARGGAGTPAGEAGGVTIDGEAKTLDGGVYRP